jgi:hypothetical protein
LAEVVAEAALCRPVGHPYNRPVFRPVFLGDKYPTADFLVDVLDAHADPVGFFFAQVKGTANAPPTAPRLTIDVTLDRFNRLASLTAPSYLIAVDVRAELVSLAAACRTRRTPVSSVTKAFSLADDAVRIGLYREVCSFWAAHRALRRTSRFRDV